MLTYSQRFFECDIANDVVGGWGVVDGEGCGEEKWRGCNLYRQKVCLLPTISGGLPYIPVSASEILCLGD